MVEIYTDGGARNNGKSNSYGAFGVVVLNKGQITQYSDGKYNTTNNEMELSALLKAIKLAKEFLDSYNIDTVKIYSDSAYSLNIITDWMWKWSSNNWTKKGGDIKNLELIQDIYNELNWYPKAHHIQFIKVKGHSGVEYNELADKILNDYMDSNFN